VFNAATAWSDPVASDSLAWLTFLGTSAAVRKDSNLYVRFTWNWLGTAARKRVETFSHLVILVTSLALLYSARIAIEVSRGTVVEGIPLHVSLADLYSVTAVSGLMMALFTVEHLVVLWRKPT
jgi:TRAP-type C4-dicarboxylate transport system permease small subunit